jgi:hypothetical protein
MDWPVALTGTSFFLVCAVFLWALVEILRVILAHRQRMAMIARGMHPDQYRANHDRPDAAETSPVQNDQVALNQQV